MNSEAYILKVPGFFGESAYLDLETKKVPVLAEWPMRDFYMQNGEVLRRRWSVDMAGIAHLGHIILIDWAGSEYDMLEAIADVLVSPPGRTLSVVYSATRQFDEMILKGRFTNARRAHEPKPFFPALPGAERLNWVCLDPKVRIPRAEDDLPSKGITSSGDFEGTMIHLLRDVVELILKDKAADPECAMWCEWVMTDTEYAREQIFGGEE